MKTAAEKKAAQRARDRKLAATPGAPQPSAAPLAPETLDAIKLAVAAERAANLAACDAIARDLRARAAKHTATFSRVGMRLHAGADAAAQCAAALRARGPVLP